MASPQPHSRSNTPSIAPPMRRPLEEDHAPAVSSPLNPNPDPSARARPKAPQREQREKRETLKKREASAHTRGSTPNPKNKQDPASAPSPMRYSIPEPKYADYDPPKDGLFASHEPLPIFAPDGITELRKPIDHAWNKKGYKYTHCVADPYFRHKQFYRQSDSRPYGPRMSHEDSDKSFHFDDSGTVFTTEKGWRMGRGNVVAREGRMYYEVKILKGIPIEGPPPGGETVPGPHIRMGWARREAPLDAPVGYDGYSYGITDSRFETIHRSRPNKIFKPLPKGAKSKHAKARPPHGRPMPVELITDQHVHEGDVIGLEIQLPSLSLHRKVVEGIYNPAVDVGDGFDAVASVKDPLNIDKPLDIIRDRIPVPYKGNFYFEQLDYTCTKSVEAYHDRGPVPKINPSPNHEDVGLRSLPNSHVKVYKNGKEVGIAFENILAFLPPASAPATQPGARPGYDDGMVGYFPAISAFNGGICQVNFGPDLWCPPDEMLIQREKDTEMFGSSTSEPPISEGRKLRAIGERFKEQIAEDVVWDIIDEVDFFTQDGAWEYKGDALGVTEGKSTPKARGFANPDDNLGVEVGKRY
ncbi:Ash2-trithorax family protein [Lindgomyces ingoldianus]|uniref:Ash2-trithorax family protein n=1 Tax=Lindgomyces ingoldianus TaxID=673940 RepID=A0ACB6R9M1_9PLEO|nr:Ash2-trithorax family protein [Lindgomyces ingoldianus]KAF2475161.1 Ash2-trithorax family protein [Lindgomyces ingoldianus]